MSGPSLRTLAKRYHKLCDTLVANAYPEPDAGALEALSRLRESRIFHTTQTWDGTAYIERVDNSYHWVSAERGQELARRVTEDPDRILYWLISDTASYMAWGYEGRNRRPGEDSRRQCLAEKERLLHLVRPDWAEQWCREVEQILQSAPFNDTPRRGLGSWFTK
jgi:hypothetical protein